jgi:hypothetical protein
MIKKCPSLFTKNGITKLLNYLAHKGISNLQIYQQGRKNYFWFKIA